MKIRHVIENDIVEDIALYKNIHKDFIEFTREEVKDDYDPSFTFDEFCAMMINNFEGVDEDMDDYYDVPGKPLTSRLLNAIIKIVQDEFRNDPDLSEKINEIIKNEKM